ncbi:hypothetical protein NQ317_005494 [Molorchus minor]|uniref:Uncharacterized protein n=1 Tax=Molorchus minor TaxID=1323400 RepID=A0ABQ9JUN0_9CUCU|nr:hypothetical protein NQ317_005494 [Molorchus minor]
MEIEFLLNHVQDYRCIFESPEFKKDWEIATPQAAVFEFRDKFYNIVMKRSTVSHANLRRVSLAVCDKTQQEAWKTLVIKFVLLLIFNPEAEEATTSSASEYWNESICARNQEVKHASACLNPTFKTARVLKLPWQLQNPEKREVCTALMGAMTPKQRCLQFASLFPTFILGPQPIKYPFVHSAFDGFKQFVMWKYLRKSSEWDKKKLLGLEDKGIEVVLWFL